MNTLELLHHLNKAYPKRGFYARPYTVGDQTGVVIVFNHGGEEVYNPFLGMDGEPNDDAYAEEYGIFNQDHARLLRRHNLHYEAWVIHKSVTLDVIYDNVASWSKIEARAAEDPSEWLQDLGFTEYHTGGGCMAWYLEDPETRRYLLVTDDDAGFPETYAEMYVGMYNSDGEQMKDSFPVDDPAEKKPWHLKPKEIEDLAEEALNAACLVIQTKLGVTDGGYASMFFSGDETREKFEDYIESEIRNLNEGA